MATAPVLGDIDFVQLFDPGEDGPKLTLEPFQLLLFQAQTRQARNAPNCCGIKRHGTVIFLRKAGLAGRRGRGP